MSTSESSPPFQDDTMLEGGARRVMADINQFFSKERLERAAMADERVRLARELHDGVLQSMAASLLKLEALSRLIDEDPQAAHKRLQDIGDLIADEQRELREWIDNLKPSPAPAMASNADIAAALTMLCHRAETQWGLRVRLTTSRGMISRSLGDEVYSLVKEALSNVARHACAQCVDVALRITRDHVHIVVADDGVGFPFQGRYDLAALIASRLGPKSLKDRLASRLGDLVLTSSLAGARLEMSLPLYPRPVTGSIAGNIGK
jgi:signal transduction histidine kinase